MRYRPGGRRGGRGRNDRPDKAEGVPVGGSSSRSAVHSFSTLRRVHTQARQPAQKGCALTDRQDCNVGRGIDRVHVAGSAAVSVRSLDPCLSAVNISPAARCAGSLPSYACCTTGRRRRSISSALKRTYGNICPKRVSRREHQLQCLLVIWRSGMEIFRCAFHQHADASVVLRL